MKWRSIGAFILLLFLVSLLACPVGAQRMSYVLDAVDRRTRVPSPVGYIYEREIRDIGLESPQDLYYGPEDNIFVVDSWNHRVLKIDKYGKILDEIGTTGEGRLSKPEGVFVGEGGIYVADTGNARIVKYDYDGNFIREYEKPESHILGEEFQYQPTKIVVDKRGFIYVVNSNDYRGLMLFDLEGTFRGFFGYNRLGFSLRTLFIRLFATEAQKEKLSKELPPPHSNILIDERGYIYSTTIYDRTNQIKKLSPVGVNIYVEDRYGEVYRRGWQWVHPKFIDIAVDDYGIISALDSSSGRVYQYDQDGNLLQIFGGKGEGKGMFNFPASVIVDEDSFLYILDKDRNNIQVFRPTHFARLVHKASQLYWEGRYAEAAEPWKEVLKLNANYFLAYTGLGQNAYKQMKWEEAMSHYEPGKDRDGYSKAFGEYRHQFMRERFGVVVVYVVLVLIVIAILIKLLQWFLMRPEEKTGFFTQILKEAWEVTIRPQEGFLLLKRQGTTTKALALIGLVFVVRCFSLYLTSFQLRTYDVDEINLIIEIMRVFLPWAIWILASYGVTIIYEGEGTIKDITIGTTYCLIPYLVLTVPQTLLTHVATLNEVNYFHVVTSIITFWVGAMIVLHVRSTHNFTLRKAVGVSALSVFGMLAFIGAVGLTFGLINQLINFFQEIYVELSIR